MLKSDRLVCEKNATKAQPVTNCNLGSINYVYFNYKVNLLIGREKILQHYTTSTTHTKEHSVTVAYSVVLHFIIIHLLQVKCTCPKTSWNSLTLLKGLSR